MKTNSHRMYQKGFTLIELLVVMAIGVGIYALSTGKFSKVFGDSNVTAETSNLNALMTATKQLKATGTYGTAATDLAIELVAIGGVPTSMPVTIGTPDVISNVWGGTVVIKSTGAGFTIAETLLPISACVQMAKNISTTGVYSTTTVNAETAVVGVYSTAQATTDCSTATNTITWTSAT